MHKEMMTRFICTHKINVCIYQSEVYRQKKREIAHLGLNDALKA